MTYAVASTTVLSVPSAHSLLGRNRVAPETRTVRLGVVSAFPPGRNSLNEFGLHLVTKLASKHDVKGLLLFADETDAGAPVPIDNVTAVPCWKFNDPRNLVRIAQAIRKHRPDAVLINLQFATFGDQRIAGGLGLLLPALLRQLGIPTVVVLHNLADNVDMADAGFAGSKSAAALMSFAGRILTRAILRADLVALTIPKYVEFLRDRYGATNVLLAPHGSFDVPPLVPFVTKTSRTIMAFGKWGTYKTVDMLVQAFRVLHDRGYDNIELVIAGTDSPNSAGYLASIAEKHNDLAGLRFTGYVAEEDVESIFRTSDVVVFPYTSTTGSSGVLHQAGMYGCATVLPRIGDFVDVIEEEGFTGEYFDPANPVDLADAIARVIDSPARREALGAQNYAAAVGIPIEEVADWHLIHIGRLLDAKATPNATSSSANRKPVVGSPAHKESAAFEHVS